MGSHSLSFELNIIRATNISLKSSKDLFVRCYLPAGSNKRVTLDTQKISSNSNLIWNQTLSLNSLLNENSLKSLKQGTIILELRSRNSTPFMAKMRSSKLVATAEIPWNETKNIEAVMTAKNKKKSCHVYNDDVTAPTVQVGMKLVEEYCGVNVNIGRKKKANNCERRWHYCGCTNSQCNSCSTVDNHYFLP